MPEPTRSRLLAAAAGLHKLDVRARQITEDSLRATAQEKSRLWFGAGIMLLLPLALLGFAIVGTLAKQEPMSGKSIENLASFFLGALPPVGCVLFIFRWMGRKSREKAEEGFAADPPRAQGASATCHVCGAALPPSRIEDKGVSRCTYCHADNIVDTAVMARMASRRRLVLDDFEVDVRRHATSYRDQVTGIGLGVVFYFLPVWLASVGVAMWLVPRIGVHIGRIAERAPNPEPLYLLAGPPKKKNCVFESNGKGKLRGASTRHAWRSVEGAADAPTFSVRELVGRSAETMHGETSYGAPSAIGYGEVVRVYADGDGNNWAVLARSDRVAQTHSRVADLCDVWGGAEKLPVLELRE